MSRCVRCGRTERPLRRGLCHAEYERDRRAGVIATSLVDATPAKAKIAELLDAGWGTRRIAKAAGVNRGLVSWIMRGRTRIAAKTRDAICGIRADGPDHSATAHRELCEAGMRGDYVSPQRGYRHARPERRREGIENVRRLRWVAAYLDVPAEQLLDERRRERPLPFPEAYAELRHHCGLTDARIATRMGIANGSLLRRLQRHGIPVDPEFASICAEEKRRHQLAQRGHHDDRRHSGRR